MLQFKTVKFIYVLGKLLLTTIVGVYVQGQAKTTTLNKCISCRVEKKRLNFKNSVNVEVSLIGMEISKQMLLNEEK